MTRGRKAHADPPHEWKISLPSSVAAEVELILGDPLSGMPRKGARSQLIVMLLRDWIAQQRKKTSGVDGEA